MILRICQQTYVTGLVNRVPSIDRTWGVLENTRQKQCFCPCTGKANAMVILKALKARERWTTSLCWATPMPTKEPRP